MSEPASDEGRGLSRADRKREAILSAAQQTFTRAGFVGTSMDEVAAAAAVSKQTVYRHFRDKETLFREVVTNVVRARDRGIPGHFLSEGEGSIEEKLRSFSRDFLRGVMQPEVLKLRRLVIAEAGRFPELGRSFYELGPKRAADQLAVALNEAATRYGRPLEDPNVAAEQLLSLILSTPLNQSMLLGDQVSFTRASLDRYADEGVAAFLRAYGFLEGDDAHPTGVGAPAQSRRRRPARGAGR
jgi:TetR/AcrR family transcriptional repressor of mexJK operon